MLHIFILEMIKLAKVLPLNLGTNSCYTPFKTDSLTRMLIRTQLGKWQTDTDSLHSTRYKKIKSNKKLVLNQRHISSSKKLNATIIYIVEIDLNSGETDIYNSIYISKTYLFIHAGCIYTTHDVAKRRR